MISRQNRLLWGLSRLLPLLAALWVLQLIPLDAQTRTADGVRGHGWAGTWSASPAPSRTDGGISQQGFADQTVRMVVRTSVGGSELRVRLSNAFGARPVTFEAATVAVQEQGSRLAGPAVPLTFGGQPLVTVRPGADAYSDPVPLAIQPQEDVTVSLYVRAPTGPVTWHAGANATTWVAGGNHASDPAADAFTTTYTSWFWLSGIDVANRHVARTVVTLGDSITDGSRSTLDANNRYPDFLARRLLAAAPPGRQVSVLNNGIGGNRILNDGPVGFESVGVKAVARFDRDVLAQTGVTDVILLEGINDIGFSVSLAPDQDVSAAEIIEGMRNLIARAHAKGLRIYGGTLLPFQGAFYSTPQGEAKRQAVNHWIRTSGEFDAVVDFDAALRDPADPLRFRPEYDSGDHLHPSDVGYRAMAQAVDLSLFGVRAPERTAVGVGG
ncbi:MAG TPA: SGNH/GDSL hydrolase family protein [Actinomycetes bacterium]|jgi:lysophospholipase L1-like esterase|nr:SGNH/GDSL hydrolase family protein [Actinomycetes bacterium]